MSKVVETKTKITNVNGANQHVVDLRQEAFWQAYIDPKSKTFSNVRQSGLSVGYSKDTADTLSARPPVWLQDKYKQHKTTKHNRMLRKAEKRLEEFMDMSTGNTGTTKKGDIFHFNDAKLVKIKQDTSKFVAARLGKDDWSEKKEVSIRHESISTLFEGMNDAIEGQLVEQETNLLVEPSSDTPE